MSVKVLFEEFKSSNNKSKSRQIEHQNGIFCTA